MKFFTVFEHYELELTPDYTVEIAMINQFSNFDFRSKNVQPKAVTEKKYTTFLEGYQIHQFTKRICTQKAAELNVSKKTIVNNSIRIKGE